MPTLAVIGDVHARFDRLDRVLERVAAEHVDGVLLVGDLGSHDLGLKRLRTPEKDARYLASVDEVLTRTRQLGVPVRYVPGNHDLPDLAIDGNLDFKSETVGGLVVCGLGGAGPARFGFCYEWKDEVVRERTIPPGDVLLCHAPPARTALDRVPHRQKNVGSEAVRELATRWTGFLVCGHIHESASAEQLGACLCMNVGGIGEPFGKAQVGFLRRDEAGDVAWHEDLEAGHVRRWRREASPAPRSGDGGTGGGGAGTP